jgi:branched chain amino acid efflux pump
MSEQTPLSSLAAGARDTLPMMVGAVPLAIIYGALVAAARWRSGMGN